MNWEGANGFPGLTWLREKEGNWPQTSQLLVDQKRENIEQVFEVVSEEKDMDWEKNRIFA